MNINHTWTSDGSSGVVGTPVELKWPPLESVIYSQVSTIATQTQWHFDTAMESSGPWFTEATSSVLSTAVGIQQTELRVTGPYIWARVFIDTKSTGNWSFRLVGSD